MKLILFLLLTPTLLYGQRPLFTLSQTQVETYEYADITLHVPPTTSGNPLTDVLMTGLFISPSNDSTHVKGFCDAPDGHTYRIRFMPTTPGTYRFTIKSYAIRRRQIKNVLTTGLAQTGSYSGTFTVTSGGRKGGVCLPGPADSERSYTVRPGRMKPVANWAN